MEDSRIHILHIVGMMNVGGVQKFLLELYRNIDKRGFQFSFAVQRETSLFYDEEINLLGGDIYFLPLMEKNIFKYSYRLYKLLKNHREYKIVHIHLNRRNVIPLIIAKLSGVPVRIAHSHSKADHKGIFKQCQVKLIKLLIGYFSTHRFACSTEAGKYLFDEQKFTVIKNAINTEKFKYSQLTRDTIRNNLDIGEKVVYGHVGNFAVSKNYFFILDIFTVLKQRNPNSILLLVGNGGMFREIEKYVQKNNLVSSVIFVGNVDNVHEYMNAMDAMIFPSLYEGLGIVAIEAQSVGLPVFASDRIPKEVKLTNNIYFISLSESKESWATKIEENINNFKRQDYSTKIIELGYDVKGNTNKIEKIYYDIYKDIGEI